MARKLTYWEKRQIQLFKDKEKRDAKFIKKINAEYDKLLGDIKKDIAYYYQEYSRGDVLDYRKMLEKLSPDERNLVYRDYTAFAKKNPNYANLEDIRDSIYKLNRLEGLEMSMRIKTLELGGVEEAEIKRILQEHYKRSYEFTMQGLTKQFSRFPVNHAVMELTISTRWANASNFSSAIWKNKDKLNGILQNELKNGLIRGDNYASITKAITQKIEVGKFEARRLIFTEGNYVLNQGNLQAFRAEGIKRYEYSAIMDSRTSVMCQRLNGITFYCHTARVGYNLPPMHAFCRSCVIPIENHEPDYRGRDIYDYSEDY